jgi:hypothetical protein
VDALHRETKHREMENHRASDCRTVDRETEFG